MHPLLILALLVGLAALVWLTWKPYAVFVVQIRKGLPSAAYGKVTEAFLSAIEEVCRDLGVDAGEIRGVPEGRRISLWFSRGLPKGFCQRLRNWWAISGWPAGPKRFDAGQ